MRIFNYDPNTLYFTDAAEADECPGTRERIEAAQARIEQLAEQRAANVQAREAWAARPLVPNADMILVPPEGEFVEPFPGVENEPDPEVPLNEWLVPAFATTLLVPTVTDPLFTARFVPDTSDPHNPQKGAWEVIRIPPEPVPRPATVHDLWASWHGLVVDAGDELVALQNEANAKAMAAFSASIGGTPDRLVVDAKKRAEADAQMARAAELVRVRALLLGAVDRKKLPEGDVPQVDAALEARFTEILQDADAEVRAACEALL